jgi:hypothetical protein
MEHNPYGPKYKTTKTQCVENLQVGSSSSSMRCGKVALDGNELNELPELVRGIFISIGLCAFGVFGDARFSGMLGAWDATAPVDDFDARDCGCCGCSTTALPYSGDVLAFTDALLELLDRGEVVWPWRGEVRGDTRPCYPMSLVSEEKCRGLHVFYLFRPAEATAVAQVAVATGASSPFRCVRRVTVRAVFLQEACASSALALLLGNHQLLNFLRQQAIPLLKLPQLKLPS